LHGFDTVAADLFAPEVFNVVRVPTKNASRLILAENYLIAINVDLEAVLFADVEHAAELDGDYHSPKLIDFADDAGGFHHCCLSPLHIKWFV
jgi:hypothetical protein